MHTTARAILSLTAVAGLATAATGSAHAASSARFNAYVKGVQVTTWDEPNHLVKVDCNSHDFRQSNGSERLSFHAAKPKVVRIDAGGGMALMSYGKSRMTGIGIPTKAHLTRSASIEDRAEPSTCSHGLKQPPKPKLDCGTRSLLFDATLNWVKPGRAELNLAESDVAPLGKAGFDTCPLELPMPELTGTAPTGGGELTHVEARAKASRLLRLKPGRTKVISGSQRFSSVTPGPFDSHIKSTQVVHWQVRLLRLKR